MSNKERLCMARSEYKSHVRANPGDCYIACLLFTMQEKYGIKTSRQKQIDIFMKGVLANRHTFFMGQINEFVSSFNKPVHLYISEWHQVESALRERESSDVEVNFSELYTQVVKTLIDQYELVTLAVDRYIKYPYYHDYYFVTVTKNKNGYAVFDPYSGFIDGISDDDLDEYVYSTRKNLDDMTMAIVI